MESTRRSRNCRRPKRPAFFSLLLLVLSCSVSAAEPRTEELVQGIRTLLRKAKEATVENSKVSATDLRQVGRIESDFLDWKTSIEKALLAPASPNFPDTTRVQLISGYFTQLTHLLSLKIGLKLPHDRAWQSRFALEIPEARLATLPGLAALNQDRAGSRYYSLVFRDGRLRLSDSLVLGAEANWLTYAPNEPDFLTLVQLLTFRQLVENLAELRTLLPERKIAPLELPISLQSKFGGLFSGGSASDSKDAVEALMKDHQRAIDEPALRSSLAKTVHSALAVSAKSGVRFHNTAFVHEIADNLTSAPALRAELESKLTPALDETIEQGISSMLEAQIASSSLPLSELGAAELERLLRHWYATAQADAIVTELIQYISDGTVELDDVQRNAIMNLIDRRRAEFESEVLSVALATWNHQARKNAAETSRTRKKSLLTENLLKEAARIQKIRDQGAALSATPDLELLAKVIEPRIQKQNPRETVRAAFRAIIQTGDYAQAKKLYSKTLKEWNEAQSKPRTKFSKGVSALLAERLHLRMMSETEKDIVDLKQIGYWMSFDDSFGSRKITAGDLITQPENRKTYEELAIDKILQSNPLLATEVNVGEAQPQRLADFLGWMMAARGKLDRPKAFVSVSLPFVSQALVKAESHIRETARMLAEAKKISDIELITTSSLTLGLILQAYPEYTIPQRQALDSLMHPSLEARLSERYIQPYLSWGFGSLMVLQVAKWGLDRVSPVTALFLETTLAGLNPLIKTYIRTAIPLTLFEGGIEIEELMHKGRKARMAEALFFSAWNEGTTGRGWMDFGEMSLYQTHYEWSKWILAGHVALNGLFLYYPEFKEILAELPGKLELPEFLEDCGAFEKLGLQPGDWKQVEAAYGTHPAEKQAFLRLAGKIRDNSMWSPELLTELAKKAGAPSSSGPSAFQKLMTDLYPSPASPGTPGGP